MPWTPKPRLRPRRRRRATSPALPRPNRKPAPTTTVVAWSASWRTRRANSGAGCAARSGVKGSTATRSTPRRASRSAFCSRVMRVAGARSGARTREGWGSKVSTTAVPPLARASATACATSAWWPRWTPSKLPTVTAGRGQDRASSVSRRTRSKLRLLRRQHPLDHGPDPLAGVVDATQEVPVLGEGIVIRTLPGIAKVAAIDEALVDHLFEGVRLAAFHVVGREDGAVEALEARPAHRLQQEVLRALQEGRLARHRERSGARRVHPDHRQQDGRHGEDIAGRRGGDGLVRDRGRLLGRPPTHGGDQVPVEEVEQHPAGVELAHADGVDDPLHGLGAVHLAEDPLLFGSEPDLVRGAGRGALSLAPLFLRPPAHLDRVRIDRGLEDDVHGRDLLLDDRPLVDHPDPFHQDEVRAHRVEVLAVVVHGLAGGEMIFAVAPTEDLEDDLRDLDGDGVLEVLRRDVALRDEHVAQALQGLLLRGQRLFQPLLAQLALLDEHVAQAILEALGRGVGVDHHAVFE